MKRLLLILLVSLNACGRPIGYKIGTCFKVDDAGIFYKKIVAIYDDKYSIKVSLINPPEELKEINKYLPLPLRWDIAAVDADETYKIIECPKGQ